VSLLKWPRKHNAQLLIALSLSLVAAALLYRARAALLPFILGSVLVYVVLPVIDWLDLRLRSVFGRRRLARSVAVLVVYISTTIILVVTLASIIPQFVTEVSVLIKRLPQLARQVYSAAPEVVQVWIDWYNQSVPVEIRQAVERSVQDILQGLLAALQTGLFKSVNVLFSTVSFVLGLLIVPLWTFYVLRDLPELDLAFYRLIPAPYREDVHSVRILLDRVCGAYLRRQLILCISVGLMFALGLGWLRIDFALLLGIIMGILEIVPVVGPILGAIPALILTLATAPSKVLWVALLAIAVQQIENILLVPQVDQGTFKLHPAVVMVALVVGGALAGAAGVILSVPATAILRDLWRYIYLRTAENPLSPQEALLRTQGKR